VPDVITYEYILEVCAEEETPVLSGEMFIDLSVSRCLRLKQYTSSLNQFLQNNDVSYIFNK
jgi:hypothetical protein